MIFFLVWLIEAVLGMAFLVFTTASLMVLLVCLKLFFRLVTHAVSIIWKVKTAPRPLYKGEGAGRDTKRRVNDGR